MFLRDANNTITFEELRNQAKALRDDSLTMDGALVSEPFAESYVIPASIDLDTAATIATRWLAHAPSVLVSPLSSHFPPPSASIRTSIINPPSSILVATSGSTGRPKWVAYTRAHVAAAALASEPAMRPSTGSAWLLNLPLHHAGGLGILLRSLVWGTPVHVSDRRDAEGIMRTITDYTDIDTLSLVPAQLHDILSLAGADRLRRLRNILVGAGSLSEQDLDLVNRHRLPIRQSYGMTETLGHFCITERACDVPIGFRSCGRPLPGNELTVVGDDGQALPDGQVGHILIRGRQVISDYAEPEPSKFEGGWFRTGDYGYLEKGGLYFVARRTDMIKTGGENVIAARVESALKELTYIQDCAIVGIDDPRWGQRVHACISVRSGANPNIESLRNDLRNLLLPFELPRSLSLHEIIPRNAMGKLQRELLVVENPEIL